MPSRRCSVDGSPLEKLNHHWMLYEVGMNKMASLVACIQFRTKVMKMHTQVLDLGVYCATSDNIKTDRATFSSFTTTPWGCCAILIICQCKDTISGLVFTVELLWPTLKFSHNTFSESTQSWLSIKSPSLRWRGLCLFVNAFNYHAECIFLRRPPSSSDADECRMV